MRHTIIALLASTIALPALAEPLTPVEVPEVAYPYAVLGIRPGMLGTEAEALMAERGITLTPEVMQLRASKPDGAMFDLEFDSRLLTQGISVNTRMGGRPYEEVTVALDTGVLERRVISASRVILAPNSELPQYPALRQQLVELYGEPSLEESTGAGGFTLIYAWIDGQQVADLSAVPEQEFEFTVGNGQKIREAAVPCRGGTSDISFTGQPLNRPIGPGCSARLTVNYRGGPSQSQIGFTVVDFDLARLNHEESMKQINEALNPTSPPKASNMDL